nr:MAG TPA: hypothetical protein [Caudoviricetes sp.]
MGNMEKNGIVGVDDLFNLGDSSNTLNREDDIMSIGGEGTGNKNNVPVNDGNTEGSDATETVEKPNENTVEKPVEKPVDGEGEKPILGGSINYRGIVDSLNNKGIIDLTNSVFTNDEGEELTIDNIDLSDEDHFCDFIATIMNSQKEELMQDKIDVNSVSDFTKKLIEAEKSGANIVDILKEYDRTSSPIEKLDIENKSDQLKIIRHYVDLLGLPKEDADEYYNGIVSKGDDFIEARALKYKADLNARMNKIIEERKVLAEQKRAKDLEDLKRMKKELKTSLSQKYQLNDSMLNKALNFRFSTSEQNPGMPLAMEKARQILMNPEEAPDLIMFLMNPDEFIKQKSSKRVKEEKIKTYKMVTTTNKNRSVAPVDNRGSEIKGIKVDEIELNNI